MRSKRCSTRIPRTFVRSYVAKGGQGPTGELTLEFLASAIAGGVAGHATYDMIKASLFRTFKAFRRVGGEIAEITDENGAFVDPRNERLLRELYDFVMRIPSPLPPRHNVTEAMA